MNLKITPSQKQALSGFVVGVLSAALVALEQALANPPFTLRGLAIAAAAGAVGGIAHYLPAFGTAAKVEQAVASRVAEVISKEAP